jgi:hypothetical protein
MTGRRNKFPRQGDRGALIWGQWGDGREERGGWGGSQGEQGWRLLVIVYDISERRQVMLFMEGLTEPLRGWVKSLDPSSLQLAMRKARDLESSSRSKVASKSSALPPDDEEPPPVVEDKGKSKGRSDDTSREDLRRHQLCYWCKGPFSKGHTCVLKPNGPANRGMWVYTDEVEDESSQQHEDVDEDDHTDDRVYTVMSIDRLVFDSHVQDLHRVQNWSKIVLRSPKDLSVSDISTFTSPAQVLGAMLQVMLLVLMMVLAFRWFNEDRDIVYFLWDPAGGFCVTLDCLGTSNFREGGL